MWTGCCPDFGPFQNWSLEDCWVFPFFVLILINAVVSGEELACSLACLCQHALLSVLSLERVGPLRVSARPPEVGLPWEIPGGGSLAVLEAIVGLMCGSSPCRRSWRHRCRSQGRSACLRSQCPCPGLPPCRAWVTARKLPKTGPSWACSSFRACPGSPGHYCPRSWVVGGSSAGRTGLPWCW